MRQAAADRVKNKRHVNDEGDSGGEEKDAVSASSGKRGHSSGNGNDSNKVVSKRSRAIAESRRGEISRDIKNRSKQNSGGRALQVQGRGGRPRGRKQAAHTETPRTMMLKYWEALREAVRPEFCSQPRCQGHIRDLRQYPLREGTGITTGMIAIQMMATRNLSPLPRLKMMTRILVMPKL